MHSIRNKEKILTILIIIIGIPLIIGWYFYITTTVKANNQTEETEQIECGYTKGTTANGKEIKQGKQIQGPAIVKTQNNNAIIIPINKTYTVETQTEIYWQFTETSTIECLKENASYFAEYTILE